MSRTQLNPDAVDTLLQTEFDDTKTTGSGMESTPTNLIDNINNAITMLREFSGSSEWYTKPADNTETFQTTKANARQVFAFRTYVLTDVTVTAAQNYEVLNVAGGEAPTVTASVGAVTTEGAVVAYYSGFPGHSLVEVTGPDALNPVNLCLLVDAATGDAIQSSNGFEIKALLQYEINVDGDPFNDTDKRVQLSFVERNAGGTDLIATLAADIATKTINYSYPRRLQYQNLPESVFLTGFFADNVAAVDVTLTNAATNQSGDVTYTTKDINWVIPANEDHFQFEDGTNVIAKFERDGAGNGDVTLGSSGASSDITIAGSLLDIDVSSTVDIKNGLAVDTDAAGTTINIGVTPNQIDVAGNLTLDASAGAITTNATDAANTIKTTSSGSVIVDGISGVEINSTSGSIQIGNDADAQNILIGTGGAARTISIGNETGATALDLDAGTGGVTIDAEGAGVIQIGNQADTGTISIGTGVAARTITIGNATGATVVDLDAGTGGFTLDSTVDGTTAMMTWTTTGGADGDSVEIFVGETDPSAGGGVVAPVGSMLWRDSGGTGTTGEAWLKTGAGNTDWEQIQTGGGDTTLQVAYENGNTITTNGGEGNITFDGTEDFIVGGSVTVAFDTTDAITFDADANSNFTVDDADLTLSTTTGGVVDVDGEDGITIDSNAGAIGIGTEDDTGDINIGTGAAARSITVGNTTGTTGIDYIAGTGGHDFTTGIAVDSGGGVADTIYIGLGGTVNGETGVANTIQPGTGGNLEVRGGAGASNSGYVSLATQDGGTDSDAGTVYISPGDGVGTGDGGDVSLNCGDADTSGNGGSFSGTAGTSGSSSGAAGTVSFTGGTAGAATVAGGAVTFQGGTGNTTGVGGAATLQGGIPGTTGVGGAANVYGRDGGSSGGAGGGVNVASGSGQAGNTAGGEVDITTGAGFGTGSGGVLDVNTGTSGSGATGDGGDIDIDTASSSATNGDAGNILINTGDGTGSGDGGDLVIGLGDAVATGNGGYLSASAGASGSGSGIAGYVTFTGGTAGYSGCAGGDVTYQGGTGNGSGAGGPATLRGGTAGTTGVGGAANVTGRDGGSTSGNGGGVNIASGSATSGMGGEIDMTAGSGTVVGGDIDLNAGSGAGTGGTDGGIVWATGGPGGLGAIGDPPTAAGTAGSLRFAGGTGGAGTASSTGGSDASDAGAGGPVFINGGFGGAGASGTDDDADAGPGGDVNIMGGAGGFGAGTGQNADGGGVILTGGSASTGGAGFGAAGYVQLRTPTGPATTITQGAVVVEFNNQGTGTGGGQAMSLYTGTATPTHSADTGSLFLLDDNSTGKAFLNDSSGGSGTDWVEVCLCDSVTLDLAVDNQGTDAVTQTQNLTWNIADAGSISWITADTSYIYIGGPTNGQTTLAKFTSAPDNDSVILGNAATGTSVALSAGSGNMDVAVASGNLSMGATSGNVALTTTTAGTIDVDGAGTVSINSSGGNLNIGDDDDTGDINIGTNASGARDIDVGSSNAGTTFTVTAGTSTCASQQNANSFGQSTTQRDGASNPGVFTSVASYQSFENATAGNLAINYNTGYTTNSGTNTYQVFVVQGNNTTDTITDITNNGAASNPTMTTTGSATYSAGKVLLVTSGALEDNQGLYEVVSHVGTTLTLAASPTAGAEWVHQQVTSESSITASVTDVTVSVLRANSSGQMQIAESVSDTSAITWQDLGSAAAVALEAAWANATGAGTVLANSFTGEISDGDTYLVQTETGNHALLSLAAVNGADVVTVGTSNSANQTSVNAGTGGLDCVASGTKAGTVSTQLRVTNTDTDNGSEAEINILAYENASTANAVEATINVEATSDSANGVNTVNIQNTADGTVNIAASANDNTVNLNTGAAAKTTAVGSTNTTSATTIEAGSGAGSFTVAGANLTLSTTTAGDAELIAADTVQITAGDEAAAVGNPVNINAGDGGGDGNDGGSVVLEPGQPGGGAGEVGVVKATTDTASEGFPIIQIENNTGGAANVAEIFTGVNDPDASNYDAPAGSIFLRDTGATGEVWVNTSVGSGTDWSKLDTSGVSSATRQDVYDNQGVTVVSITANATLDLVGAGTEWLIRDEDDATLFSILENSDTSATTITFGAQVDVFDCDAAFVDMDGTTFNANYSSTVDIDAGAAVSINSTGGALNLGDAADAQNINVGTGAAQRIITIGNETDATAIDMDAGIGGVAIDAQGAGGIDIGVQNDTGTINIGTNAGARTINIGSTSSTTLVMNASGAVTIDSAAAGVSVDGAGASNFSTSAGALTFDAEAGAVTIDAGGGALTIQDTSVGDNVVVTTVNTATAIQTGAIALTTGNNTNGTSGDVGDLIFTGGDSTSGQAGRIVVVPGDGATDGYFWIDSDLPTTTALQVLDNSDEVGGFGESISFFVRDRTPEGAISANQGSVCYVRDSQDSDNGKLFIKETGAGTNTLWSRVLTTSDNPVTYSKTVGVTTGAISANTNVSGTTTPVNLDATLGDYSGVTFTTKVNVYVNGALQRNGVGAEVDFDCYPGTDQTTGDLKFENGLRSGDTIIMEIFAAL